MRYIVVHEALAIAEHDDPLLGVLWARRWIR